MLLRHTNQCRPSGVILLIVLLCLAIAGVMSVVVLKQIVVERNAIEDNCRRLQAIWLAEAGVERAAARLAADPTYTGETWNLAQKDIAGSGVVKIAVGTVAGHVEQHSIRVEAAYVDALDRCCRHTKQIVVDRDAIHIPQPTKAAK